jgi:ribosomal protein S21
VQITVMTAFPNAPLYDRLAGAGRLIDPEAWNACTLFDVNYRPEKMTVAELENGFRDLARRIYDTGFIEERRRRFFERQSALRKKRIESGAAAKN